LKSEHGQNNLERHIDSSDIKEQLTRRSLTWVGKNGTMEQMEKEKEIKEERGKKEKQIKRARVIL